jgi:hypothetical protein
MADHPPLTEERRQAYRHRAQLIAQRADRQLEQTLFRTSLAILALAATVAATTQIAHAEEESGTDTRMLMQERHEWAATPYRSLTTYGDIRRDKFPTGKITIREALAAEVRKQFHDDRWVAVALRIVQVESRFNALAVGPKTRYGHALGLGQLLLSSAHALGYQGNAKGLLGPATNIRYTVAHMRRCMEEGVKTDDEMAGCHVAGWSNFRSRSSYARSYRRMVAAAETTNPRRLHVRVSYALHRYRYAHVAGRSRLASN